MKKKKNTKQLIQRATQTSQMLFHRATMIMRYTAECSTKVVLGVIGFRVFLQEFMMVKNIATSDVAGAPADYWYSCYSLCPSGQCTFMAYGC